MGVIKGSARSLGSLAALHQEEYVARSRRLAPTFVLDDERKRIYSVFESYEALKTSRREVDDVDRVVNVLKVLRRDANARALMGSAFDEIYIDGKVSTRPSESTANISIEVQDQRTLDIGLFLNLVKDCRGFHFGLCNRFIRRAPSLHSCISWGYCPSDLSRVDIPLRRH